MSDLQLIAGHRVLRRLATGARSHVWLAPGDLVLKVVSPGEAVIAEAQALERARGAHVVELVDVAVDDEQAVLIFERLPAGSLAQLLAGRAGLDAGEAVTVLAPIAACLARLHTAGVAHRAVSAETVLFRSDGAPVLIGFGSATVLDASLPEVMLERDEGVLADRRALQDLAMTVLGRVSGPRSAAAAALAEALRTAGLGDLETRLERELFDLAASRPIRFEVDAAGESVAEGSGRRVVDVAVVAEPEPPVDRWSPPPVVGRLLESGAAAVVRSFVQERWRSWSPRRRRTTLAAGAAGLALVVAVTAIPPAPPVRPADAIRADEPDSSVTPDPVEAVLDPVVAGDDPLAALPVLLDRRTQCFRDLSVLCLDEVDEPGSSALSADRAALDALLQSAQQPVILTADGATVTERLGDSALIALAPDSDPASLLLLKGEAGWRIRDLIPVRSS